MAKDIKVSIVVPIHDMQDGDKFLWRLVNSLTAQTFKDWELIITKDGKMAENSNAGIKRAHGEFIKILYLDDYFTYREALEDMVSYMKDEEWGIVGTHNNMLPYWTDDIEKGNNKLGSPSALIFRNRHENLLFDESMSWLLDCDLYKRMFQKLGKPFIIPGNYVTLGEGPHQMTHILTNEEKLSEHNYMQKKYEQN